MNSDPTHPTPAACSFCNRAAPEVTIVLTGALAQICAECCALSMSRTWDDLDEDSLLDELKGAENTIESARATRHDQVIELRRRGVSWDKIGRAMGISRQAAWERFS